MRVHTFSAFTGSLCIGAELLCTQQQSFMLHSAMPGSDIDTGYVCLSIRSSHAGIDSANDHHTVLTTG